MVLQPGLLADDLVDLPQVVGEAAGETADHAVGVAQAEQHGADDGVVGTQARLGDIDGHPVTLAQLMVGRPALLVALVAGRVDDVEIGARAQLRGDPLPARRDDFGATNQDRARQPFVDDRLGRAQHAFVLAIAIDDARFAAALGGREHRAHADATAIDELRSFSRRPPCR
jgi:hypothetical protein